MPKRKRPSLTLRESKEKRLRRLQSMSDRARARREAEDEEERSRRLEADTDRARARREAEEEEERSRRLASDAARKTTRREAEEEEERARRLASNAARERSRREEEDEDRRLHRRKQALARYHTSTSAQYRAAIGSSHVERLYIGLMDIQCDYCSALQFHKESLNCCHGGKVSLLPLRAVPQRIFSLLTADTEEGRHFGENIRVYNSCLAFASMGANIQLPPGYGPYCYRIHGQIYHWSGPLHPGKEHRRQYSQLYILEGSQAVEERLQHPLNASCRQDIMRELLTAIEGVSPYASAYRHMAQVEQEECFQAEQEGRPSKPVTMFFKRGRDQRRYNNPLQDDIAAVFVGEDGAPPGFGDRDIVVHPHGRPCEQISILSANCDPMVSWLESEGEKFTHHIHVFV